ncbi:hypothetical protein J437_LFUL004272 [Ladona fulva]|uniref:Uncharacterized protein n=1 Tax=Ladona fulva TaxID=123851 RepID=A0A8K0KFG6_LADFU|nr:hypothetical protein J437_LFUL004272 [Ladona fulva]
MPKKRKKSEKYFRRQICKDIQEFYELTLLDESKSVQQKTAETIRIANKWEIAEGGCPMAPPSGPLQLPPPHHLHQHLLHHQPYPNNDLAKEVKEVLKAVDVGKVFRLERRGMKSKNKKSSEMPKTSYQWKKITHNVLNRWKFPHWIGSIDGKLIQIIARERERKTFQL